MARQEGVARRRLSALVLADTATACYVGQTFLSGHPGDRPDKNVWPTRSLLPKCECHVRAGRDVIGWPDKKAPQIARSALSVSRIPRPHVVWAGHSSLAIPATGQTSMSGPQDHCD